MKSIYLVPSFMILFTSLAHASVPGVCLEEVRRAVGIDQIRNQVTYSGVNAQKQLCAINFAYVKEEARLTNQGDESLYFNTSTPGVSPVLFEKIEGEEQVQLSACSVNETNVELAFTVNTKNSHQVLSASQVKLTLKGGMVQTAQVSDSKAGQFQCDFRHH